jgi:hypothetical protein
MLVSNVTSLVLVGLLIGVSVYNDYRSADRYLATTNPAKKD